MFIQKTFKNHLPSLYVVGTPIGNLSDLSFRAIEVLKSVDVILCEDTRTSALLLKHYQIEKPLVSLHKFNELARSEKITEYLSLNKNLALISDAGVPTISDPGAYLINNLRWVEQLSFNVSAINAGPAYIHALAASGFVNFHHYFYGFIQNKNDASKRIELEEVIEQYQNTLIIFYESVHRIKATIKVLNEILNPKTNLTLSRELTKSNEEIIYGNIGEINEFVNSDQFVEKGEFVIIIDNLLKVVNYNDEQLIQLINEEIKLGFKLKQAVNQVSKVSKVNKNYLYELYIKHKN